MSKNGNTENGFSTSRHPLSETQRERWGGNNVLINSSDDDSDADSERNGGQTSRNGGPRDLLIQTNVQFGTAPSHVEDSETAEAAKSKPVSWRSLPRKDQLFVLTLARLSEPLTQTSLGSYLFYQLQSFDHSLPDSTISYQASR